MANRSANSKLHLEELARPFRLPAALEGLEQLLLQRSRLFRGWRGAVTLIGEGRGPVLSGEISVERALRKDAEGARPLGVTYRKLAAYDPVPRSHCRLDD